MRKLYVLYLLTAVALGVPTTTHGQQTAKDIIKKVIEANGGEETLKKYPAAKVTWKGTMQFMGFDVAATGDDLYQLPGMSRSDLRMEIGGMKLAIVQIYNNGKAKITVGGKDTPVSEAIREEMKQGAHAQTIAQYVPLLDEKQFEVSVIEKPENVEDKEVVGLLVKSKDNKDVKLFFDAKRYLLLKMVRQGLDPQEKEVKQETLYKEYKKFNDIPWPVKTVVLLDGKKFLEVETTSFKPLEKLDKKEFDISD